jgi:hypothetical protein
VKNLRKSLVVLIDPGQSQKIMTQMIRERVRMIGQEIDEVYPEIGIDVLVQKIDVEVVQGIVKDAVVLAIELIEVDLEIREVAHAIELIVADLVIVNKVDLVTNIVDLRNVLIPSKIIRVDVTVACQKEDVTVVCQKDVVVTDQYLRIDAQSLKVIQNSYQSCNLNFWTWQRTRIRKMAHHHDLEVSLNPHHHQRH